MKNFFFTLKILSSISIIFSEDILNNGFNYRVQNILRDYGKNWDSISCFNSLELDRHLSSWDKSNDSLKISNLGEIKYENNQKELSFYNFIHFNFKNSIYFYLYPRLSENGLKSQIDISGFGYQNNWVQLHIGRGRENWGAGNEIQLAISNKSNSYNYFKLASDYGKIRVNYIHGFLESTQIGINRYITARGIEWTNKGSTLIGLSETIIYSGYNRGVDIGYINPIASHLEVELNNRLSVLGNENANAVWQAHLDYLIRKEIRVSANFLFDEFVFDRSIEFGKEHGYAYSFRISYSPQIFLKKHITFSLSSIKIGTPTFRHFNGTNNFVLNSKPLGWENGSDGEEMNFGINFFNQKNILGSFSFGVYSNGEESIINRPYDTYEDYLEGSFPSGIVKKSKYMTLILFLRLKPNININYRSHVVFNTIANKESQTSLGLSFYF